MEVDANMVEDELSFMPGAANQTALSEWGFLCDGPCQRKGFWYLDEAAAVVKEQKRVLHAKPLRRLLHSEAAGKERGSFGSKLEETVESRKRFQTQTGETPQQIGHEAQNPDTLRMVRGRTVSGNMNTCSVVPPGKLFENYSHSRGWSSEIFRTTVTFVGCVPILLVILELVYACRPDSRRVCVS